MQILHILVLFKIKYKCNTGSEKLKLEIAKQNCGLTILQALGANFFKLCFLIFDDVKTSVWVI